MSKLGDIRDQFGNKIGEIHSRPDYEGQAATAGGCLVVALVLGIFLLVGKILAELVRLTIQHPKIMLPLYAVLIGVGTYSYISEQHELQVQRRLQAAAAARAALPPTPGTYQINQDMGTTLIGAFGVAVDPTLTTIEVQEDGGLKATIVVKNVGLATDITCSDNSTNKSYLKFYSSEGNYQQIQMIKGSCDDRAGQKTDFPPRATFTDWLVFPRPPAEFQHQNQSFDLHYAGYGDFSSINLSKASRASS